MPRTEYETQISSLSAQVGELGGMAVEAVERLRASLASDSLAVEAVHPDLVEDDDGTAWGSDAIAPVGHAIAASRTRERVVRLRCARLAPEGVPEVLMVAKYLERIADRAVRVASWGAFRETGDHLGAQALAERDPSRGDWRVP